MAGTAQIGALNVRLGIDTASFSSGLKASQTNLAKFGKTVAVGFAAVATAAVAASAALGVAVKGAIDHADELGKVSQKIGLSVESLSRLEYAAKLSDVSLEGLTTGLRKFSQVIVEASSNGKSGPATVFAALGVSVKDASGNLRDTNVVFSEVAQQLSRMEDGALKTSLAVQLFGKSGADLIPLLNSGAAGLADMAKEADRVGATISGKTAKAAETFNDTLTRIEAIMGGVVNKIMAEALPSLQDLANKLASPEFATAAASLGSAVVGAMASIVEAATLAINKLVELRTFLNPDKATIESRYRIANGISPSSNIENRVDPNWKPGQRQSDPVGAGASFEQLTAFMSSNGSGATKPFVPVIAGAGQAKAAVTDLMAGLDDAQPKVKTFAQTIGETMANAFSGFADAVLSGVGPLEAMGDLLGNIGKQLLNSAISNFFGNLFGGGLGGGTSLGTNRSLLGMPLFADGGVTNGPAIFGEAGPEAAVPLPDGRSIPVTLSGGGGGMTEVLIRLDQGIVAQILKQADGNAVKIVDSRAPLATARFQKDRA